MLNNIYIIILNNMLVMLQSELIFPAMCPLCMREYNFTAEVILSSKARLDFMSSSFPTRSVSRML